MLSASFLHYAAAHPSALDGATRLREALVSATGSPANKQAVSELVVTCCDREMFDAVERWRRGHDPVWAEVAFDDQAWEKVCERVDAWGYAASVGEAIGFAAEALCPDALQEARVTRTADGWRVSVERIGSAAVKEVRFSEASEEGERRVRGCLEGLQRYGDEERMLERLREVPGLGSLHLDRMPRMHGEPDGAAALATSNAWAKVLRASVARRLTLAISQGQAQEALAALLGVASWNHLLALESRQRVPVRPFAVQALGLKPAAVRRFREMNLYALEDFAEVCEQDLRAVPDVGQHTISLVRELLARAGLGFRAPTHSLHRAELRAKLARARPPAERRRDITDDSEVADLGLKWKTLSLCLRNDLHTVGQLRQRTLRDLWHVFGKQSLLDALDALDAMGLALRSNPDQLERWRWGAIRAEALLRPGPTAPIAQLRPWLGELAGRFERDGIVTVGQLQSVASAGGRRVSGIGQPSWDRVFDYFGLKRQSIARK